MLAELCNVRFIDTDKIIVQRAGKSIDSIFETEGEPTFRNLETAVISEIMGTPPQVPVVVSTGGGAVMRPENAGLIFAKDFTSIWVKASIPVILERIKRSPGKRPLLKNGNPEKTLEDLAAARDPIYSRADIIIDTDSNRPEEILDSVIQELEKKGVC